MALRPDRKLPRIGTPASGPGTGRRSLRPAFGAPIGRAEVMPEVGGEVPSGARRGIISRTSRRYPFGRNRLDPDPQYAELRGNGPDQGRSARRRVRPPARTVTPGQPPCRQPRRPERSRIGIDWLPRRGGSHARNRTPGSGSTANAPRPHRGISLHLPGQRKHSAHSRVVTGSAVGISGYGKNARAGGRQGLASMRSCRTSMAFVPCLRAVSM